MKIIEDGTQHNIEKPYDTKHLFLKDGDQTIGRVTLHRYAKFYHLVSVQIQENNRGKKFGSILIEYVNRFLKDQTAIGILENALIGDKKHWYEHHGWNVVEGRPAWLFFGDVNDAQILQQFVDMVINQQTNAHHS